MFKFSGFYFIHTLICQKTAHFYLFKWLCWASFLCVYSTWKVQLCLQKQRPQVQKQFSKGACPFLDFHKFWVPFCTWKMQHRAGTWRKKKKVKKEVIKLTKRKEIIKSTYIVNWGFTAIITAKWMWHRSIFSIIDLSFVIVLFQDLWRFAQLWSQNCFCYCLAPKTVQIWSQKQFCDHMCANLCKSW